MSLPADIHSKNSWLIAPSQALALPPRWLRKYNEFVAKNASQVSQMESALRSLTYIIPGRFRDAEIASETIHSGVQLLSLYHDSILLRLLSVSKLPGLVRTPSQHNRYTRFWMHKSALYRRVALVLQVVQYTELLCEMAAKRRANRVRWRVVVLIEAVKAVCRLLLLRITRLRPVITPALPERQPISEPPDDDDDDDIDDDEALQALLEEEEKLRNGGSGADNGGSTGSSIRAKAHANGRANGHPFNGSASRRNPYKVWTMPRTGMSLPTLPQPGDTSSYLLSRVLTADDIKPAIKLLNQLHGPSQAAEILHILAPLVYATILARSKNKKSWTPWLVGLGMECAARQLRDRGLRTTALERDEWGRRGWAMGWWVMRGAFYETVTKGVVGGVRSRVPSLVAGIVEDYEYLWENYHFSTSS